VSSLCINLLRRKNLGNPLGFSACHLNPHNPCFHCCQKNLDQGFLRFRFHDLPLYLPLLFLFHLLQLLPKPSKINWIYYHRHHHLNQHYYQIRQLLFRILRTAFLLPDPNAIINHILYPSFF